MTKGHADQDSWASLMVASQQGDACAHRLLLTGLARWIEEHYGGTLPEDLLKAMTQSALTDVHTRRMTYDPGKPFMSWLSALLDYRLSSFGNRCS